MLCTLDLSDSVSVLQFILLSCVLKLSLVTGQLKSLYFMVNHSVCRVHLGT